MASWRPMIKFFCFSILLWPYFIQNVDIVAIKQCSLGRSFTLQMTDLITNDGVTRFDGIYTDLPAGEEGNIFWWGEQGRENAEVRREKELQAHDQDGHDSVGHRLQDVVDHGRVHSNSSVSSISSCGSSNSSSWRWCRRPYQGLGWDAISLICLRRKKMFTVMYDLSMRRLLRLRYLSISW